MGNLDRLQAPLTMSMFASASDLASEALKQRDEAVAWIWQLLEERSTLSGGEATGDQRGSSGTRAATVSPEFREGQKIPTPQKLEEAKALYIKAEPLLSGRPANHPATLDSERICGLIVNADVAGLSDGLFMIEALRDLGRRTPDLIARAEAAEAENEKLRASLLEAVVVLEPFANIALNHLWTGTYGPSWGFNGGVITHELFIAAAQVHARLSSSLKGGEGSGWLPIESAKPKEYERILVATADTPPVVGEAWWREENGKLDLWWAGTGPDDYYADPISQQNQRVTHWRPLPPPPEHQGGDDR